MPSSPLRPLLVLLAALLVLASCGGSDDDSGDTTTTTDATQAADDPTVPTGGPVDEDYCNVVKNLQASGNDDYEEVFDAQLAVAPDEVRGAIETLRDNIDILEAQPEITSEQRDIIGQPLVVLLSYQINRCGLPLYG